MIWIMLTIIIAVGGFGWRMLNRRGLDGCVLPYVAQAGRRRQMRNSDGPVHLLLCIADHFEPQWGNPSSALAAERVERWSRQYPELAGQFRDSDGRAPRHTFFFPVDQYEPQHVEALARLHRLGLCDVEIHLHHDHDTAENLRRTLMHYKLLFAQRHGLLSRRRGNDELVYGFVHGNWALNNPHPDGRCCGVDNELDVLRETGCYADFTFPSAPSLTQARKINSLYYARNHPDRRRSHDRGVDVGAGGEAGDSLMLIAGPLVVDWQRRKIENACIQASQPPDMHRLDLWLGAGIGVKSRPDWRFVKLHTHGAAEGNQHVLLGDPMWQFHRGLQQRSLDNPNFQYHYVTAREMYNLARAAEAGFRGSVAEARDYELIANGEGRLLAVA